MGDTGANQSGMKMLPILIEKGQLSARLCDAAIEIAPLRGIGTHNAHVLTVYG